LLEIVNLSIKEKILSLLIISFLFLYFMMLSTNLVLESIVETQLKLKILHFCRDLSNTERDLLIRPNEPSGRLFLSLLYSFTFKKVLSGKINNRTVINYFKKFSTYSTDQQCRDEEKNKNLFELEYLNSLAINSLYEILTIKNDD